MTRAAAVAILALVVTLLLMGCGVYGQPVRSLPAPAPPATDAAETPDPHAGHAPEPSDETDEELDP